MIAHPNLLTSAMVSLLTSRGRLEAEVVLLRHQLNVLRRAAPQRLRFTAVDRLIFVWLYRLFPSLIDAVAVIKPATLLRWHRGGFRLYWRWRSRSPGGRPKISRETRRLIREMSLANPLWGAPRIHGELLRLGIEVGETTVAKYMVKGGRPSSQTWRTFLSNQVAGIAAMDFLVVPTIGFRLLYALVILRHDRRQIVLIGVTGHPTAQWIARQIAEVFAWDETPCYLIRDRDAAYGHSVRRRLQAMGIRDRPTAPRSPWQNAYVERVIGSIRRDCLDHIIVLGEAHLRRTLKAYVSYYNGARTHLSLQKDAPFPRPIERVGRISSTPILGGLHHQYGRT